MKDDALFLEENIKAAIKDHPSAVSTLRNLLAFWRKHYQDQRASLNLLAEAARFAAGKHEGQSRSHAQGVPYIVHPFRVAALLWEEGGIRDETVLLGALLHDTLDNKASYEEIVASFGETVGRLVQELAVPKERGFDEQLEHCKAMSTEARIIKIADCTHDLQDLLDHPPLVWHEEEAGELLLRCYHFFQAVRGVHGKLEEVFASTMEKIAGYVPEEI